MSLDTALALTDLTTAKAFLKVTATGDDGIITDLINSASQFANEFTGRYLLKRQGITEYYDGDGSEMLILRNHPVIAVTTLADDLLRLWPTPIPSTDILLDGQAGIIRVWNGTFALNRGKANLKVVYDAGYDLALPGSGGGVPADLKMAVHMLIDYWYRRDFTMKTEGLQSETKGDQTLQFKNDDVPPKIKTILNSYKSHGEYTGYAFS